MMPPEFRGVIHNSGHFGAVRRLCRHAISRTASAGANLTLLWSWRATDQADVRSRIPQVVPPRSRSRRVPTICPSSQTILASEVIQEIVALRTGEPEHEAGAPPRHRVERNPVEARPGTEQKRHQLTRTNRAGIQTTVPISHIQPGLFLEAEHGQRLAKARYTHGKRIRKGFRASTRNPEPRKPSHRCYLLLPTIATQNDRARRSNPHY
jgi:hypothetical protein